MQLITKIMMREREGGRGRTGYLLLILGCDYHEQNKDKRSQCQEHEHCNSPVRALPKH